MKYEFAHGWPVEAKNEVARLLQMGLSASQIAAHFPGKSRNAIIGVVHRDRLLSQIGFAQATEKRDGTAPKKKKWAWRPRKQTLFEAVPLPEPGFVPGETHLAGQPMASLAPHRCKFSVNDASRLETHLFCGLPADGPYCSHHKRIVYQPGSALVRANRKLAA